MYFVEVLIDGHKEFYKHNYPSINTQVDLIKF